MPTWLIQIIWKLSGCSLVCVRFNRNFESNEEHSLCYARKKRNWNDYKFDTFVLKFIWMKLTKYYLLVVIISLLCFVHDALSTEWMGGWVVGSCIWCIARCKSFHKYGIWIFILWITFCDSKPVFSIVIISWLISGL